jgi:hypothetical protein
MISAINHVATADVTGIKLDTTDLPPVIGDPIALAPIYGPPYSGPINSFEWAMKHTSEGCVKNWVVVGTSENLNFNNGGGAYSLPGQYEFRLTVTYGQYSGGGPPRSPSVHFMQVSIGKVDGARIVSDAQGESRQYTLPEPPPEDTMVVTFHMTSGGEDCGPYFSGAIQEKLTSIKNMGQNYPDIDWDARAAYFYRMGPLLQDHKYAFASPFFYGDPNFNIPPLPIDPATPFASYTQRLRVVYYDYCGNYREGPEIGPFYVEHHKVSATNYDVTISNLPPLP